jgi:DNA-binding beta-propeller fold protein YncE
LPRSTHTQIVDASNGTIVGDVPDNSRSHGVALVPELRRGFISNGGDGTIQVFDLKSNKSLGKISAAPDADCILYDVASNKVLAFCGDANVMIAVAPDVDVSNGQPAAKIDLGGKPEFAVSDGRGKVFVNLVDKDEVAVVDTDKMSVVTKWPVKPGKQPVGLSLDPVKRRLYIGCRSRQMVVMNANDGTVLGDLPIGSGVDATAFFNDTSFASCSDGTLTIIRETSPGKFEVAQTLKTAPRAKTMAIDTEKGLIYLPTTDGQGRTAAPDTFRVLVVGEGS